MGTPSRFQNQQKAAEQKKALFERMQERQQAKKAGPVQPDATLPALTTTYASAEYVLQSSVGPITKDHPRFGGAGIRLYQDHAEVPLIAAAPLARLVDVYLEAAANKTAYQVLSWPVAPQALPLVHVLATME